MKKDCSEYQLKVLKKLVRLHKPTLPISSVSIARKHTLPAQMGRRTTRSETAKLRAEANAQEKEPLLSKNESKHFDDSSDSSTDSQSDLNVPSTMTNDGQSDSITQQETAEEKSAKKPRKKRISRALFRHDNIDYIKPKKQDFLQKSFSFKFKKLVDKSKEIYSKNDECCETDADRSKEMTNDEMDNPEKFYKPTNFILDMPSLDSPGPEKKSSQKDNRKTIIERDKHPPVDNIQVSHQKTIENGELNNVPVPAYFYNIIPNKQIINVEQQTDDQIPQYKITIVPDHPKTIENQPKTLKTTKMNKGTKRKHRDYSCPYLPANPYEYRRMYPYIPPPHAQNQVRPIWNPHFYQTPNAKQSNPNCTIVTPKNTEKPNYSVDYLLSNPETIQNNSNKKNSRQNFVSQIPLVQNIPHRYQTKSHNTQNEVNSKSDKNNLLQPINHCERMPIIVNNIKKTTDSVIVSPNRRTNEQRVIIMKNNNITQPCSVIKHTQNKNLHTIENILSINKNTEINNNKSVITTPEKQKKTDESSDKQMPKLIDYRTRFEINDNQPLNLSLKRQSIIVNNKQKNDDPLDLTNLTFIKNDEEYNENLKLLKSKAHGPYLFYKFISGFRSSRNQPIFDLVTFFSLLKQGKLYHYKVLYNQFNK